MTWLCAQIGAREHYAIPRALHQTGRLAVLYTDFWAGPFMRALGSSKIADKRWKMGALRSLAARWHPELQKNAETLKAEIKKSKNGNQKMESGVAGRHLTLAAAKRENPVAGGKEFQVSGFSVSAFSSRKAEIISWNGRSLWWEILRKAESGKQRGGIETVRHLTPALSPIEAEREKRVEKGKTSTPHLDRGGEGKNENGGTDPFQISAVKSSGPYHGFIEVGRRFATCVRENLKRRTDLGPDTIFYAYDTGALEAFAWCREHGVKCVLNQMDPNRVEMDLVRAEERQWPGWALHAIEVPEAYFNRREREWALADRIVVNSEFSRRALVQQGVPPEKLVVIPLCFEAAELSRKSGIGNRKSDEPLRVLFLGQVILRKGIQYLMAAAKQMEHEDIQFDIVGPLGISAAAIATAPKNVVFHGRTGRDQAAAWYRQSHLFVLPTLSDGFALTQLEAMAHGLPVVTTPCCGDVVSDGVDGFIVPPREIEPLVQVFRRYLGDPELLRNQSAAALVKARQFTGQRLAENLQKLEVELKKAEN